jgi:hypothetical protein
MAVALSALTLINEGLASGYSDCSRCARQRGVAGRTRRLRREGSGQAAGMRRYLAQAEADNACGLMAKVIILAAITPFG